MGKEVGTSGCGKLAKIERIEGNCKSRRMGEIWKDKEGGKGQKGRRGRDMYAGAHENRVLKTPRQRRKPKTNLHVNEEVKTNRDSPGGAEPMPQASIRAQASSNSKTQRGLRRCGGKTHCHYKSKEGKHDVIFRWIWESITSKIPRSVARAGEGVCEDRPSEMTGQGHLRRPRE